MTAEADTLHKGWCGGGGGEGRERGTVGCHKQLD